MRPTALIFRSELLPRSETFIAAQAAALVRYRPVFAGTRLCRPSLPLPGPVAATLSRPERALFRRTGWAPRLCSACRAHTPSVVHAHFAPDGATASPLARGLNIPLLVTLHGYDVMRSDAACLTHPEGRLFLKHRQRLWRESALFLCVSEAVQNRALESGYPSEKLRVLPIGVDAAAFPAPGELPSAPQVLFVGRLVPKKGCFTLLQAFALLQQRLPAARLTIAGNGPERASLEAYAARHTNGTMFLGVQTSEQVRSLMRGSRCLAAPSLTAADGDSEGLPTVLGEALALGLPVASTFHSGIPELITHGRHGLLSGEGDAETLARHLEQLCTDTILVETLRARGREQVERSFNLQAQTRQLESIYDEVRLRAANRSFPAMSPTTGRSPHSFAESVRSDASKSTDTAVPPAEAERSSRPDLVPLPARERLRRQALWLFGGNGCALVFQALYFLLIGRLLGASEYGAFVGIAALIGVLSQFSSLGMEMVLLRTVARDRGVFPGAWARALVVSGAGFLLLFAIVWVYGRLLLPPALQALLPYLAVSDALFGKLTQLSSRAFQGAGLTRWSAGLLALTNAARALAAGALFMRSAHVSMLAWARVYCLASLAVALLAFALVTYKLGRPRRSPLRRAHLLEGLSFSFSSSAITVYNDIDKSMLLSAGLAAEAGIYGAAYRILDVVSTPIVSLFAAASPRLFREGAQGGPVEAARGAGSLLRWTIPYGVVTAVALFAGAPLVPKLFGVSFARSTDALRFLCLLPLLRGLHYAWGTAITASASQWLRTAAQGGVAAANILLNLLLIPRWGWRGAALASLASDGALALATYLILQVLARHDRRPVCSSLRRAGTAETTEALANSS